MRVVQLQEQLLENTCLRQSECEAILPCMDDGAEGGVHVSGEVVRRRSFVLG